LKFSRLSIGRYIRGNGGIPIIPANSTLSTDGYIPITSLSFTGSNGSLFITNSPLEIFFLFVYIILQKKFKENRHNY
jgi:hypothetical protein